jgi:hypothetical protein
MSIKLPKAPIKPDHMNPGSMILYGPVKVGKTTFVSELDGVLLLDLENGSDFVEAMKLKINNLSELGQVGNSIVEEKFPYKYIAIDSITKLEEWLEWEATELYMSSPQGQAFNRIENYRPSSPKDKAPLLPRKDWISVLTLAHGSGYLWLRIAFKRWFDKLNKLAPHIIYIGHLRDKIVEKMGTEVDVAELDLTGKIRNIAGQNVDAIGFMFRDEKGELKISFQNHERLSAGTRCPHLKGQIIDADWKKIFLDE